MAESSTPHPPAFVNTLETHVYTQHKELGVVSSREISPTDVSPEGTLVGYEPEKSRSSGVARSRVSNDSMRILSFHLLSPLLWPHPLVESPWWY